MSCENCTCIREREGKDLPVNPEGIELGDIIRWKMIIKDRPIHNRILVVTSLSNEKGEVCCNTILEFGLQNYVSFPIRSVSLFEKKGKLTIDQIHSINKAFTALYLSKHP